MNRWPPWDVTALPVAATLFANGIDGTCMRAIVDR